MRLLSRVSGQLTVTGGWKGDSQDTIGVVVPLVRLLVGTSDVAVLVSGLLAYPTGLCFNVVCFRRLDVPPGPLEIEGCRVVSATRLPGLASSGYGLPTAPGCDLSGSLAGQRTIRTPALSLDAHRE
jgi:hypothetical protein